MNPRMIRLAASLLCLASWHASASAQTLGVGDDAPPLAASKWAKGDEIARLEADRTYVVEFWATWCGPCRTSIPHLTQLQKQYKDKGVRIIGVSVFEQDPSLVAPFVKEMGDSMDYSVALDDVPKGEKGVKGKMAESWMIASGSDGIPTAFIVSKGKVAWIGHPMEMDKPLARVASGDFDIAKAAGEYREEKAAAKKVEAVTAKLQKLGRTATTKAKLDVIDGAIAEDPALEKSLGLDKFLMMIKGDDPAATAYAARLVEGVLGEESEPLNRIAWAIVDPKARRKPSATDLKLALKAATRADELAHGEDASILDTLALASFANGDPAKALAAQEKAIKLAGDENEGMKSRLGKYRKAVAEKKP